MSVTSIIWQQFCRLLGQRGKRTGEILIIKKEESPARSAGQTIPHPEKRKNNKNEHENYDVCSEAEEVEEAEAEKR